jgi:hypothetical protein
VRLRALARTLDVVELRNLLLALVLMGGAWFATVRILAWSIARDARHATSGGMTGKPSPANHRARLRHFPARVPNQRVR